MQNRDLANLFNKPSSTLEQEFDALQAANSDFSRSGSRKTTVFVPGRAYFSADRCLGDTIILSQAPTRNNYDAFQHIVYLEADAIITLMQDRDYWCNQEYYPYFDLELLKRPSDFFDAKPTMAPHPIVERALQFKPLQGNDPSKIVPHFHFNHWLDGWGIDPHDLASLARLAMRFRKPLIHCLAGKGRSGTLAALILAYRKILQGDTSTDVVKNAVIELRAERVGAVNSVHQYASIYEALQILLKDRR